MTKISLLLLVVCVCSLSFCQGFSKRHANPKLQIHPLCANCFKVKVVILESDLSLKCPLAGVSYVFEKEKLGQLTNGNQYNVSGNTLKIKKVFYRNSGKYLCIAKSSTGNSKTFTWYVFVLKDVRTKSVNTTELLVGSRSKQFNCKNRNARIMYYDSDNANKALPLLRSDKRLYFHKGVFRLLDLRTSDTGYYYCRKPTSKGIRSIKIAHIIVRDIPRISTNSKHKIVKEGKMARLTCMFSGSQNLFWYKNGMKITQGLIERNTTKGKKKVQVLIKNATKTDDGDYECRVTVGGKTGKNIARLSIFHFVRAGVTASGRKAYKINCQSNIPSDVKYTLLHKNFNAKVSTPITIDGNNYRNPNDGLFEIVKLRNQDKGEYTCEAETRGIVIRKKAGVINDR